MTPILKDYFPLIRTRAELLHAIRQSKYLNALFQSWTDKQQNEFLDFCTGVRGVKLLYDSFFKEIMSPETTPERLEEFLSLLLDSQVQILDVLPNDSVRLADEQTLLITDVVVELADGRIVNVEVQKIGYRFPGQRSACYSSDLLLRQYKRVRSKKGTTFSYRDISAVYTIVLFETCPAEFRDFPDRHLHFFSQKSDSGLELELLQNYCFIPLDIFRKNLQNMGIRTKLDAWLAFLCMDDPEVIIQLITAYPEFRAMYEQIYSLCQNIEGVMDMFSEELRIMDRNTVRLMIDEQQEEIDRLLALKTSLMTEAAQLTANIEQLTADKEQLTADKEQLTADKEQLTADKEQLTNSNKQLMARISELETALSH